MSLAIGRNAAYMQQFLYRGTPKVLPEDVRETLARHLEVEGDTLRHREVPPRGEHLRDEPAERPSTEAGPPVTRASAKGFVAVTEIDVRASAGPGAIHDGLEEAKGTWLFPDPVIRHEFRTKPEYLHIITIDGARFIVQCGKCKAKVIGWSHEEAVAMWQEVVIPPENVV